MKRAYLARCPHCFVAFAFHNTEAWPNTRGEMTNEHSVLYCSIPHPVEKQEPLEYVSECGDG